MAREGGEGLKIWPIALSLCTTALSCESPSEVVEPRFLSEVVRPRIVVTTISSSQLPEQFTTWTYSYKFTVVHAESLLAELIKSDIPVSQAWLPLNNLCMDPVGPRFTVELAREDARVAAFDFMRGPGRLRCATQLKWYTLTRKQP